VKLLAAVALALLVASTAAAARRPTLQFFRMPSRNVACLYSTSPTELRCDILSGLKPKPRGRTCELDWTGFFMRPTGQAAPNCAGDTVYNQRAPIVAYGRKWRRGGFVCYSRRTGLRCQNRTGHGFVLARERSYTF
jgi:Family of unknown function (DUF6636)